MMLLDSVDSFPLSALYYLIDKRKVLLAQICSLCHVYAHKFH